MLLWLLLVCCAFPANSAVGQTTAIWDTNAIGNWSDGSLWSTDPEFPNNGGVDYNAVINSGTVTLDQNIEIATLSGNGGTVILSDGNLVTVGDSTFTTFSGAIQGSGSLTKVGSGGLTLAGTNSYTGQNTINGGTLSGTTMPFNLNNSAFGKGNFSISNGGTLEYTGSDSSRSTSSAISFGIGGGSVAITNSNAELIISGLVSGTGGLTKTGSGALKLFSATNTYAGGTTISSGTLQFDKLISMPSSGGVAVNSSTTLAVNAGGTGQWSNGTSGGGTIGGLIAGIGGQGTADQVTWNSGSFLGIDTQNAPGGALTYGGVIGDFRSGVGTTRNDVGLRKVGPGTLTLSGSNSYSGGTIIRSGRLQFANTTAMPSSGGVIVFNSQDLAINAGGASEWTNGLSGGGTIGGLIAGTGGQGTADQVTWNSGSALGIDTTNAPGGSVTYSGVIGNFRSGPGTTINFARLTKLGSGTLILSGSNTYSAGTTIRSGTLQFAKTAAMPLPEGFAISPVEAANGATLAVNVGGAGEWTNGTSGGGSIGGLIAGIGGQGTVDQVNWSGGSALGIDTTNAPGGTLTYSGTIGNFRSFPSTTNNVGLTKLGSGTLALTGTSAYSGNTIVNGGELSVTNGGTVTTNRFVFIGYDSGANGTLSVGGGTGSSNWTINGHAFSVGYYGTGTMNVTGGGAFSSVDTFIGDNSGGNGTVNVGGGTGSSTWTTNGYDINVGYRGTGTMNVTGGGTVSGFRGLLGQTVGSSGTVNVGGGTGSSNWTTTGPIYVGSVGTGAMSVTGGGTVSSSAGYIGSSIGSSGTVNVGGGAGIATWTTNGGDLWVGDAGTGTMNISGGGSVSSGSAYLGRSAILSGGSIVTGRGTVSVGGGAGSATWAISGSLTIGSDLTTGTLDIKSNGLVSATGPVTFGSLGTLSGTGTISGNVTTRGRTAPGNSPGILTINGDYTQTADGTLEIEVASYSGTMGMPAWVPGTDHDQLQVTGTATLGGRLEIPVIDPLKTAGGPTIGLPPIDFLTANSVVGEFSAVVAPGLNPNLAVDVEYITSGPNQGARLSFVPIKTNVVFDDATNTTANWFNDSTTWEDTDNPLDLEVLPTLVNDISIQNLTATAQEVEVETSNALVAKLTVGGGSAELKVTVGDGSFSDTSGNLSSTLDVTIENNGVIAMNGGTLATPDVTLTGGVLKGNGLLDLSSETFANTGTLTVTSGTISPGFSIGELEIDGALDLTNGGELFIEAISEASHDMLVVTGEAILEGSLTLDITGSSIQGGDSIQILTAEQITEGLSSFEVIGNDDLFFALSIEEIAPNLFALSIDGFEEGDMNRDGGMPDVNDVAVFALALTDPLNYRGTFGVSAKEAGDIDDDGDIDVDDIDDFADLLGMSVVELTGRIAYSANVPEPATLLLLAMGSVVGLTRRNDR